FDEKLLIDLRVLGADPGWHVDADAFEHNMNIIGKVRINGAFSEDPYTQIAAFAGDSVRGVANLEYDENYDEYFLYLTVYSNASSGEEITFKVWDASHGKVLQATVDGATSVSFIQNEVMGFKSAPVIFEGTHLIDQHIPLNEGWTWISLYAADPDLADLDALT